MLRHLDVIYTRVCSTAGTTMEENGGMNDAGSNIAVENRLDDITPEEDHVDSYEETDDTVNQTVTRSG